MRDAFAGFCDALFNQELRDATTNRLRRAGVLRPGQPPPSTREGRVALIRGAFPACLLDLIYRFQFISDDRDYEIVSSYVNNAPLLNQFIHEFIQNAEDSWTGEAEEPGHCRFVFEDDRVLVINNGRAFTHENLYAICSFRESDKAGQQRNLRIGKFGVGFKSVFRVTRSPLVVTWDDSRGEPLAFRFFAPGEFDREHHLRLAGEWPFHFSPKLPECERPDFPSRIGFLFPVPVPLEGDLRSTWEEHRRGAGRGSMFWLPLRPDLTPEPRAKIFDRVEPESFLFLKMQSLEVEDRRGGVRQVRAWSKLRSALNKGGEVELLEVEERRDDAPLQPIGKALRLETGPVPVPRDEFQTLDHLVRSALPDEVRVLIVAELDGDNLHDPGPDGSRLRGGLFNGLPVPGVATGLNVHVDAPFNLSADRTNILDDAFNEWLVGVIDEAVCRFLTFLVKDNHFRNQAFRLVPADLGYGRKKGVGELTQRFARIHDRLREEARNVGVLPALDEGEPLRPGEALALRGSDAKRDAVSQAIQSLIGGQPVATFARTRTKIRIETLRLCRLPDDSYEAAVAKALGHEEDFSPRWMRAALDDPGWHARARERDPRWYAKLFTYTGGGVVADSLDHFLDIAWVPGLSDDMIPPRDATLLGDATDDHLAVVLDGLRAAGGAPPSLRFARSDLTRTYQGSIGGGDKPGFGARRLARLFAGRLLSWEEVVERLVLLLSEAQAGDRPTKSGATPNPVWDLIGLADRYGALSADSAARLSRLTRVEVTVDGSSGTSTAVWAVADLLLEPADELRPLPEQVARRLPRPTGDRLGVIARLAPPVPTPDLVEAVLEETDAAASETVAWVLRLATVWERSLKRNEVRSALGALRVPGKSTGEFRPLGSHCRDGFGRKWRQQDVGLTQLFGPKTPDLGDYAAALGEDGLRRLQSLMDEEPFLPTSGDLEEALGRLSAVGDDARRVALATDLVEFLGGVWEFYPVSGRRRAELPELLRLLQERPWVPATVTGGRARPGEVVLEDRNLLDLFGDAVPAPLLPEGVEAGDRWVRALHILGEKAGLDFRNADALGPKAGQALAAGLRRRFAGQADAFKRLELVGRYLDRRWFADAAAGLRGTFDLAAVRPGAPSGAAVLWVITESPEQAQKIATEFPRGVVAVPHKNPVVRRALVWASGGLPTPQGPLIESSRFAARYLRALGACVDGPLDLRERTNVARAYRTLARDHADQSWFGPEDCVILTEEGTLAPATLAVYAGDDPDVRPVLVKHLPGRCLASAVHDLGPAALPAALTGLRLKAVQSADAWVRVSYVPRETVRDRPLSPEEKPHLDAALRGLVPDAPTIPDPERLTVRVVEAIDMKIELLAAGPDRVVTEPVNVYFQARPAVLFLTDAGRAAFESQLLQKIDLDGYEREQKLLHVFREAWAEARAHVEVLAAEQREDLLHAYRMGHEDPQFRSSDGDLHRQNKGLEERWANFLADPRRVARVVEKYTTDLGYGKETVTRELLQNIDDSYYGFPVPPDRAPWAEFRQKGRDLVVSHAGRPFSAENLVRICGLGGSGKSAEFQIGRFGLGFKSVLGVTAAPVVLSDPYAFRILNVVVPEWIEPEEAERRGWHAWRSDHAVTRFVLEPPAGRRSVDELLDRLVKADARTGDLSTRVLLFLNHLGEIQLKTAKVDRTVTRRDLAAPDGLLPGISRPPMFDDLKVVLRRLELRDEGQLPVVEEFLVVEGRARVLVPSEAGSEVRPLRCGIALAWDAANGRLGAPLGGDARLHLFLPTRTRTGLPFVINGEFLTNLGRTDIDGVHETNAGLAGAIAALTRATLQAAFTRWRNDPDGLRAVTRVAPWPGGEFQEASWLGPVRGVFAAMIKADEPVILTTDGTLAKRSGCRLGQRLAHAARGPLLAADPSCHLVPLVDPEVEAEVDRAAGVEIPKLTGPDLVKALFPAGLSRAKAILRVQTLLRVLYGLQGGDLTQRTESFHALAQLSAVPCMPHERSGVACPSALDHPDHPVPGNPPDRLAGLDAVVGTDPAFRRWVIESLRWAPPPETPGDDGGYEQEWDGVIVTSEDRDRLWAQNLRRIAAWWSGLGPRGRQEVAGPYTLTGEKLWPILGLGDVPAGQRAGRLREALHEDGPGHERTWFRLLCLANVAQSGRRFEEGVSFLVKFDREFNGFERLWGAPDADGPDDAVGDLIRRAVDAYIKDPSSAERAPFWRRLYDFAKVRTLLRERQFLPGFWDTADHDPAFLAQYLHRGRVPRGRFQHRGLGESLSPQAFFLCRECFRLGIIRGDAARENCYAPNRHLARFLRRAYGPDFAEWPDFEHYQAVSHRLHAEVPRDTGTQDFEDFFDLPLFHLAVQDGPALLVPGLLLRDDIEGVRTFLNRGD